MHSKRRSHETPQRQVRTLALLAITLTCAMSIWFSASAVIPQLEDSWNLSSSSKAWMTIAVQVGFVAGAVVSGLLNISDRVRLQWLICVGCLGAGTVNLGLIVSSGPESGIPLRFGSGLFLAFVYPSAFKLIATWFQARRGTALGVLAAAIVLGNAMPHLVNGLGGVGWQSVIYVTSALCLLGGLIALTVEVGPFPFPRSVFDPRQVGSVFGNRGVRLATIGYFGHMWELFAMYAWFLVYFSNHLESKGLAALPRAAYVTFMVIAVGSVGSLVGGVLADRWGRTKTTASMLAVSGTCALAIGFLYGGPTSMIVLVGLVWGFAIVADSAQFSTIVTELGDQSYVGTALTMQLAAGFGLTVVTIWLVPYLEIAVGWTWAFSILALGPVVGIAAMVRLGRLPEASAITNGLG